MNTEFAFEHDEDMLEFPSNLSLMFSPHDRRAGAHLFRNGRASVLNFL